jgi:hypothetical protein
MTYVATFISELADLVPFKASQFTLVILVLCQQRCRLVGFREFVQTSWPHVLQASNGGVDFTQW